ncbi:hypothetical protein ACWEVM_14930 [Streptomyces bauhiniae]|uniref:hypothetical protein n=1 Tax=Streptomyces bauhiniae TaxID=2340725 RepID=UPI0036588F84
MLEHLHRMMRSKRVFAKNSSKWSDLRAKLLDGACSTRGAVTFALVTGSQCAGSRNAT